MKNDTLLAVSRHCPAGQDERAFCLLGMVLILVRKKNIIAILPVIPFICLVISFATGSK